MSGTKRSAPSSSDLDRPPTSASVSLSNSHPPPAKKRATPSAIASSSSSSKSAVHPFFSAKPTTLGNFVTSPPTVCHFLHLDPFPDSASSSASDGATPDSSRKPVTVIFYDLDGTLIKTRSGSDFPSNRADWSWWDAGVPARLKAEWEEGKHLIVLSNQGDSRPKIREEWKAKLPLITSKIPAGVPIRIIAALSKTDVYRKPNSGMFDIVRELYRSKGYEIDMEHSVYVGDAAGRLAIGGRRKDHGDTDYKLALNVGLKFVTPEEHFLGMPRPKFPEPPVGFHPSKINLNLPHVVPSSTPIAHKEVELVLFVGPPASGKTTFYRRHFSPRYQHVNQDILKSRDRCLRVAEDFLVANQPVVVDNTNRNRATRAIWVALANKLNVPIRCFHFNTLLELAKHNNMYRACYAPAGEPERTLLPMTAFGSFGSAFERPEEDEGFEELRTVNFVWEGSDEQRKLWERYMLEVKR